MTTVFWDCEKNLFIKYLFKNTTLIEDCYAALLIKVRQVVVEKMKSKLVKEILFLQDNTPINTVRVARRNLAKTGFEDFNYPWTLYCLGLAFSNYFLFSNLKADL